MAQASGHIYSAERLKVVVALLTLLTLPLVLGGSFLVYQYVKYTVMIEKRLKGERGQIPSRVFSRPFVLREGMALNAAGLTKVLNGLKYEQKPDRPQAPGEFALGEGAVLLHVRPAEGNATEVLAAVFEKDRLKELRGLKSKKRYATQALEPELITYLFDASREKRRLVTYEELPEMVVQAVLAIEDRRFFSHPGLDPMRIVAAAVRNIRAESYVQGASTITQQLVKNFFLTPERTIRRKAQEALLAFVLERRANKKEILELYLNEIYLGQVGSFSINGVGEAARMYFRKDVGNLTLPEAALLAGMIQSPNPYNPYRHARRATERRNVVIRSMQEAGFIDDAAAEAAIATPLKVEPPTVDSAEAPYFVDLVKTQLAERYAATDLTTGNLSVHTTLDLHLQALGQAALADGLAAADKLIKAKKKTPGALVQGSLIALEPGTGAILALVGGRSYGSSQYNRVMKARRQPGSTFKPFVYLAAFEATFDDPALPPITPATVVEDAPSVFFFEDKEYIPQNYEDEYVGNVTLRRALAKSLNVATVKVAEMVGYDRVAGLWTNRLHMPGDVRPYPAVALGSFEATPLEMATAYNVLANGGLKVEPVSVLQVTEAGGKVLEQHQAPAPQRVVHEESAFLVVNMLRSVINEGTAAGARGSGFAADAAGKTGTTNDLRDAWFAGFTPDLLCVVWVGYDDNTPVGLSGAKAALPIWVQFMKGATAGVKARSFTPPAENVVFIDIDRETGLLATARCPRVVSEAFIAGTEPIERCPLHY
ncbi:MAG TPA: PBP1A family penicillin-binding protein [Vicinamibacteria bacterium]|nr:PBP1A family penicillin-binding protein [Vicinamibacteria bacterium]